MSAHQQIIRDAFAGKDTINMVQVQDALTQMQLSAS